jgi:hypothetical protein
MAPVTPCPHALPVRSTGGHATQQRDRTSPPGGQDSVIDLAQGPGCAGARAIPAPAQQNPATYVRTTTRAAAARPRPAVPQTDQVVTIGGAPAWLALPARDSFPAELAVTIQDGTAFVIAPKPDADGSRQAGRPRGTREYRSDTDHPRLGGLRG